MSKYLFVFVQLNSLRKCHGITKVLLGLHQGKLGLHPGGRSAGGGSAETVGGGQHARWGKKVGSGSNLGKRFSRIKEFKE